MWGSFTMTSANDTPNGDFDERLAQALGAALTSGEEVVAQETGDQGQAIALTKSRILLAKAGFAATGELNGHKVSGFGLEEISAVNLRKGPLGAVIQICTEGNGASPHDGDAGPRTGTPDNVVVFTGPGRVKRAEAFVAQIEFLAGKQVNRVEHSARPAAPAIHVSEAPATLGEDQGASVSEMEAPAASKGGREPQSLAEQIYNEVVEAERAPALIPITKEYGGEEEAPTPSVQYRPNPRLPKAARRQQQGAKSILVMLGIAGMLVLIGMAIMSPVHQSQNESTAILDTTGKTGAKLIISQLSAVSKYRNQVAELIAQADAEAALLRSAVRSGNRAAMTSIEEAGKTDLTLHDINGLPAPLGLAEAKGNITSGLLTQKTAIAAAQIGSQPASDTLSRLDEASAQIRKGMSAIAEAQSQIEAQVAANASAKRK